EQRELEAAGRQLRARRLAGSRRLAGIGSPRMREHREQEGRRFADLDLRTLGRSSRLEMRRQMAEQDTLQSVFEQADAGVGADQPVDRGAKIAALRAGQAPQSR